MTRSCSPPRRTDPVQPSARPARHLRYRHRPRRLAMLRLDRPLQRLEDVAQVFRHRLVARLLIMLRDRGHDRLVLAKASLGAARAQPGAVLKTDALGFEEIGR